MSIFCYFQPSLVNSYTEDPALYIKIANEKRALLFDCGELQDLGKKKIQYIELVFISHTHVDHFIGFDQIIRYNIGIHKLLQVFGPPGIAEQVQHKILAYNWNLLSEDNADFRITEIHQHQRKTYYLSTEDKYRQLHLVAEEALSDQVIYQEQNFYVRTALLEHKTPSLAYALMEKDSWRVDKDKLAQHGYPAGPWLKELKNKAQESGVLQVGNIPIAIAKLKEQLLVRQKGFKIAYVTDTIYTPEIAAKIKELAYQADLFFCESHFTEQDHLKAQETYHLTSYQAGTLARKAQVRKIVSFHYSPKYSFQDQKILREQIREAFQGKEQQQGDKQ